MRVCPTYSPWVRLHSICVSPFIVTSKSVYTLPKKECVCVQASPLSSTVALMYTAAAKPKTIEVSSQSQMVRSLNIEKSMST